MHGGSGAHDGSGMPVVEPDQASPAGGLSKTQAVTASQIRGDAPWEASASAKPLIVEATGQSGRQIRLRESRTAMQRRDHHTPAGAQNPHLPQRRPTQTCKEGQASFKLKGRKSPKASTARRQGGTHAPLLGTQRGIRRLFHLRMKATARMTATRQHQRTHPIGTARSPSCPARTPNATVCTARSSVATNTSPVWPVAQQRFFWRRRTAPSR